MGDKIPCRVCGSYFAPISKHWRSCSYECSRVWPEHADVRPSADRADTVHTVVLRPLDGAPSFFESSPEAARPFAVSSLGGASSVLLDPAPDHAYGDEDHCVGRCSLPSYAHPSYIPDDDD